MSKIKCIIIEDEPLAVKILSDYILQLPFLELMEKFRDAIVATEYLRDHPVDLIFLDIHLPKLKGMAFLRTLPHSPAVIVTSAYHEYALEGYELNVTDYLLKPFDFERFLMAVNKCRERLPENAKSAGDSGVDAVKDHLFLTVQKKKVKILFSEILYVESQMEYVKIVTTAQDYFSKIATHEIESLLPAHLFKRIHRSYIVSVRRIESYSADSVFLNKISLPVGRAYKSVIEGLS
jgi:two-component system, LytTR family, response regulator